MNKMEFSRFIGDIGDELRKLSSTKGAEYTGENTGAFANFERQAALLGLTREQILMVYLNKHIDGINNWVRTKKEFSEPVSGRIKDAILYLSLLLAMVESERKNENK